MDVDMKRYWTGVLAIGLAAVGVACEDGASNGPSPEAEAPAVCGQQADALPANLVVLLDEESPAFDPLVADAQTYLETVAERGREPAADEVAIWVSSSAAAQALAGTIPDGGYAVVEVENGNGQTIVVTAADAVTATYGFYALLEEMGVRFFHPLDELVPEQLRWPSGVDIRRQPATRIRGIHMHTLHPVETFDALFTPGEQNLADAKRLVDWLVKTGHNRLQWYLMSTIDLDTWAPHGTAIADYAHRRGVDLGITVQFSAGASLLQNQYALIEDTNATFDEQMVEMDARLDAVLAAVPFDHVEIAFGEFFASDPLLLVDSLDHAIAYLAEVSPNVTVAVQNHIGNYEELYLDIGEEEDVYFYHLPGRADERLIQNVHTVFFFDLYRDWAMYEHESFEIQRNYIFDEIQERDVYYFPESAYWVSADIDVPVFLPEYMHARWLDIHNLTADLDAAGLPALSGHILYSSGHEWGYWMTDYVTARALWQPEAELEEHIAHVAAPFGDCAEDLGATINALIQLQTEMLFDARLVPYASADDIHDDLGYAAGIDTHPPRVPFAALRTMGETERAAFEDDVLVPLRETVSRTAALTTEFEAACEGAEGQEAAWCAELIDATRITALKLEHSVKLYETVLFAVRGEGDVDGTFGEAVKVRTDGAAVIAAREEHYRWPKAKLIDAYENPTRYPFGLYRQANTQCLWSRQEQQVQILLETGEAASPFELPTCQD